MKTFNQFNEVAPPGWGHTKAEKEKTKPDKPKSKIGGSAAAFKRALDDGRFKGLPGDKTKKEKTASMFKLMWAMKKKGAKPHYKPGTDKKYKKYQEEDWKPEIEVIDTKKRKKDAEKKRKEAEASLPPHLKLDVMKKAFASSHSDKSNTFTQESLGFTIDSGEHKKASKKAKMRNLAKGNTNPNEKAAAEKKAGGPKLIGETLSTKDSKKLAKASALSQSDDPKDQDRARARQVEVDFKDLMRQRKKRKVKEELSPMQDNNLFGNAYAGSYEKLKKKIGSKKKHNKPAVKEEIDCDCNDCGQDPCIKCGESHHNIKEEINLPLNIEIPSNSRDFNLGLMFRESLDENSGMLFIFEEVGRKSFHMKDTRIPLDIAFIKEDGTIESIKELRPYNLLPVHSDGEVLYALEVNRGWFVENNVKVGDNILQREKKKAINAIPDKNTEVYNRNWQHKTPDNPREGVELLGADGKVAHEIVDIIKPEPMKVPDSPVKWKELTELTKLPNYNKTGNIIDVYLAWRGRNYMIKTFFPQVSKPSRKEVIDQIQKVYPGCRVWNYEISVHNTGEPVLQIN